MDLEGFLARQESLGQWDSQGVFTVALAEARKKLSKFALKDPAFYVLKVIQAGVAMGATLMEVNTNATGLSVWFALSEGQSFESFVAAVAATDREADRAESEGIRLLAEGFNAAVHGRFSLVSVTKWVGGTGSALLVNGMKVSTGPAPPRPREIHSSAEVWMFTVARNRRDWMGPGLEETSLIQSRCLFLPARFRMDGELLFGRPDVPESPLWLSSFSAPFWLVERLELCSKGRVRIQVCKEGDRRLGQSGWLSSLTHPWDSFCLQPKSAELGLETTCRAAYYLPVGLEGDDRVMFLRHGVVVGTIPVRGSGAGALAIVDADGLNFDLTGFGLVRDEKLLLKIEDVRMVWREMAVTVVDDLDRLRGTGPSSILALFSSLMTALGRPYDTRTKPFQAATRTRLEALLDRRWPWTRGRDGSPPERPGVPPTSPP